MKTLYLYLAFVFLFSCSEDNEANPDTGIYKVVIEQSGDYGNYNKVIDCVYSSPERPNVEI